MGNGGQSAKREPAPETAQRLRSFRLLRLVVISVILFAAAGVGLYFKSQANPGTEPSGFSGQPPQYLNIYVTGPDIRINVTVILGQGWLNPNYDRYGPIELRAQGFTSFNEKVEFTATSTGSVTSEAIIIASSIRPTGGELIAGGGSTVSTVSVVQLKNAVGPVGEADRFVALFPLSPGQGNI